MIIISYMIQPIKLFYSLCWIKSHRNYSLFQALYIRIIERWERSQPKPKSQPLTRRQEEEELRPSRSTSTRCSSRSTPTSVSPRKPWTSWIPSFTILLTESPLRDQSWWGSTREGLFPLGRCSPRSNLSCQENSPDTPFQREPRPSLNTSSNDL